MSNKNLQHIGLMASFAIAMVFLGFTSFETIFPAAPSSAANTASSSINVDVDPTLEMALDSTTVSLMANGESSVLPTSSGVLATGDINVYVTTNNTGYRLSIYSSSETNSMKHINTNVTAGISPTAGGVSDLAADTWGFKYGTATNWTAVGVGESSAARISSGSATTAICEDIENNYAACATAGTANKHTVTFGAKVTDSLPSGRYTNNVVFSVVASGGTGN
ncbi:hypothetical protein IJ114_01300 [Candidatus Saccharibacteria bacterium]|nr:hypothetical protein [Candidatus Saccharibacteria bacterium]